MSKKLLLKLVLFGGIVAGLTAGILYRDLFNTEQLEGFLASLGVWGPIVYIASWLVAPVAFLPGSPLTLTGGALFGPVWGAVYTIFGATGGATLSFLVARYLAGEWVESHTTGIMGKVKSGVEHEGWRFVAFTRLVPLFPFNLLNYALGLTNISLKAYVVTSFLTMLPGTIGYTYIGYAGRELLVGDGNQVQTILIAIGVVAGLVLIPMMARRWRSETPKQNLKAKLS